MSIYFDHNATTAIDPRVLAAMEPFLTRYFANPQSLHQAGRFASHAIEQAREQVAALVGAHPSEVIFMSGATEANNLVLQQNYKQLLINATEHKAVLEPALRLQQQGVDVSWLPVDANGVVQKEVLKKFMTAKTEFISVMLANNETGVIQEVAALNQQAKKINPHCLFHTDAVQAVGKIRVNFAELGVDQLTLSAHKLGGPQGIGALICKREHAILPLIVGGGQEAGLRGGTHYVAGIVGLGKAAELAQEELNTRHFAMLHLQHHLEEQLQACTGIAILGEHAKRLPNTTMFAVQGFNGEALIMALDQHGFAVSSGSACGQGRPSHVVAAMGIADEIADSVIRVSFASSNTDAEIDLFVKTLKQLIDEIRRNS